jgi:hypothetical protein
LTRERSLIPDRIKTNGRTDDPMMGLAAMGLPACP